MRVLVIGGNRFLGVELTARLLARGDSVTLLNRGTLRDPFGNRVLRVACDRAGPGFDVLERTTWDAVVDFALFDGPAAARTARVLQERVGHYVMISTGQTYLVRDRPPPTATEADYDGPLSPEPDDAKAKDEWRYGVDKRDAEDTLAASSLPTTRLRLPMVHGGRDYHRRIESVLWRLMDSGPILLTQPDAPCRHVYAPAVARTIIGLLEKGPTGDAFNLSQDETVTARELVQRIAARLGVTAHVRAVSKEALAAAGLSPVHACAFNSRWMSALDSTKAKARLGFHHEPLDEYLAATVHALLTRLDGPPPSMEQRAQELALAQSLE